MLICRWHGTDYVIRYFLCPETGKKTLEQIDYLFMSSGGSVARDDNFVSAHDEKRLEPKQVEV
jgi:hypothetical protein